MNLWPTARDQAKTLIKDIDLINRHGDADSNPEWYTPAQYVEMARQVLGKIDLDPASNATAQSWIKADRHFTKEDDGLKRTWSGRTWCNPPYGRRQKEKGTPLYGLYAQLFLEKGLKHYHQRDIPAAIFLVNRTGAAWYKELCPQFSAICEVKRRIAFVNPQGESETSPRYYNDFLYLGSQTERFEEVFSDIGVIKIDKNRSNKDVCQIQHQSHR